MATPSTSSHSHSHGYDDSVRAASPASSAVGSFAAHHQDELHQPPPQTPNLHNPAKSLDLDNEFGPVEEDVLDMHLDAPGEKEHRDNRESRASIGQPPPSPPLTEPENEKTPTEAVPSDPVPSVEKEERSISQPHALQHVLLDEPDRDQPSPLGMQRSANRRRHGRLIESMSSAGGLRGTDDETGTGTDGDGEDGYGRREFKVLRGGGGLRKYGTSSGGSVGGSTYRKPHSAYYIGPPDSSSAYGTPPVGRIGVHDPREILRVERDYSLGELIQFSSTYPLELEGRISATQFIETINSMNEILISAHSLSWSAFDNCLATFTLWISTLIIDSHYEREMRRLADLIDTLNTELYNPRGLNILWPRSAAFLFLEIEYY